MQIPSYLLALTEKYAPFLIAGAVGAIINRLRKGKMTFKRVVNQILISAFLAWCLGVSLQYWLKIPNPVIYAFCSLSGMFSEIILDELEEVAGNIKEWFSMIIESWIKKPKTK